MHCHATLQPQSRDAPALAVPNKQARRRNWPAAAHHENPRLDISASKCARDASMLISVVAGWIVGSETMTIAYVVDVNPSMKAE